MATDNLTLLRRVRASLQTELDRGVITDTLWMNDSPSETIFDALDNAIASQTATGTEFLGIDE